MSEPPTATVDVSESGMTDAADIHALTETGGTATLVEANDVEQIAAIPLEIAEFDAESRFPRFPHPFWHPLRASAWIIRCLFGLASLIFLLAVIAAIPIVNFLALGYLLEVEGRLGRTGKFRNAFPLLGLAPRLGSIVLGIWLWVLPLRFLSGAAADAAIIDPGAPAHLIFGFLTVVGAIGVAVHLCLALARGGSLSCFFRPLKNVLWLARQLRGGDYFETASRHIREFLTRLRLKHHFWLGFRGFFGALGWLIIPTLFYSAAHQSEAGPVMVTVLGGFLLVAAFGWVPFLQAHFATTNRFRAFRELGTVRELARHAPIAWLVATIVIYVLALPLYLFKVALPPSDAMWFITLVFIASIFPARVVTGWAYHRAVRKQREGRRSHIITRILVWTLRLGLLSFYTFIMFFTQFIGEEGKLELFQHHSFLLPWPLFVAFN